jgi:class 3 adenylate cyclase
VLSISLSYESSVRVDLIYFRVLSFQNCFWYYCYVLLVFVAGNIYQSSSAASRGDSRRGSLGTQLLFFGVGGLLGLLSGSLQVQSEVANFNNHSLGAKTSAKIAEFVDRLLPKHVRATAGASQPTGELAEGVTLLFADIVGFTEFSASRTPDEVVAMLSKLFTAFDKECSRLNLYKVYTIGDCYVVMSFLDKNDRLSPQEECLNVVELGLKMIEIIARVRQEIAFDKLHMRIGIHTGKIIGGIIGTGIIRYDLYGHDVLIANKMESSGKNDSIHVSEATKTMLEGCHNDSLKFTLDEVVDIPALECSVTTYFIEKTVN